MDSHRFDLRQLNDGQVLERLLKLHLTSAEVMADLLCHLAEVERRRLHLREATRSIFAYAVEVLHCTEDQAWRRVTAAQTAARFPAIFERVASGDLTLTSVNMLRGVLTEENHRELLAEARHKTKAQLEEIVARLAPKPDVPARLARVAERGGRNSEVPGSAGALALPLSLPVTPVVALPAVLVATAPATLSVTATAMPTPTVPAAPPEPGRAPSPPTRPEPARLAPLSPGRWKLTLTIGAEAQRALRTARDLTPDGDLARIVERAVVEYAEKLEARKLAKLKGRKRRPSTEAASKSAGPVHEEAADATMTPEVAHPAASAPEAVAPSAPARVPDAPSARAESSERSRPSSHRPAIPRAFVRQLVERDGGRCRYVSPETGRRCSETANLHIHHVIPYARGGRARLRDLELRCAAHDAYQAVLDFGAEHIAKAIERRRRVRTTSGLGGSAAHASSHALARNAGVATGGRAPPAG